MLRALFILEFRRALIPAFVLAIAAAVIVISIERIVVSRGGANADSAAQASLLMLLAGVALSGLFAGARVFSREFKERHYPLLATLPVPPLRTWLVLTSAGLSASVAGIAVLVLTHPRMLVDPEWGRYLGLASAAHLFLFALGSVLSLACRRSLFVPVLGFPLATAILCEALSFNHAAGSIPFVPRLISVGAATTLVFFLLGSLALFVRGEFDLPTVRVRAHLGLWCGVLSLLFFVRWVHPTPLLAHPETEILGVHISPDGRSLAWVQPELDGRVRISFASGESGDPLGRWSGTDVSKVAWAPDDDALWADERPERLFRLARLLARPSPVVVRIGADGKERFRQALPDGGVDAMLALSGGRLLVSMSDQIGSRVVLLEAAKSPTVFELAGAAHPASLSPVGQDQAIVWARSQHAPKAWRFVPGGTEALKTLEVVLDSGDFGYFTPTVIGHRAFFSDRAAQEELLRVYPRPAGQASGRYVSGVPVADGHARVFYVAHEVGAGARVEVWDPQSSRWREVARGVHDGGVPPGSVPSFDDEDFRSGDVAFIYYGFNIEAEPGLVLYQLGRERAFQAFLYDDALGRSFPVGHPSSEPRRLFLWRQSSSTVSLRLRDPAWSAVESFVYGIGSGAPHGIPSVPRDVEKRTRRIRSDGSRIVLASDGSAAILRADETVRPVRFR